MFFAFNTVLCICVNLNFFLNQALCSDHAVCVWVVRGLDDLLSRLAHRKPKPEHQQLAVPVGLPGVLQWDLGGGAWTPPLAVMEGFKKYASVSKEEEHIKSEEVRSLVINHIIIRVIISLSKWTEWDVERMYISWCIIHIYCVHRILQEQLLRRIFA